MLLTPSYPVAGKRSPHHSDIDMVEPHFIRTFVAVSIMLVGSIFAIALVVDPYGVSPFHHSIRHLNRYKPQRIEIDRLIKPYEVWRYQPKTIFMGSSRIHQAFDPSVMDETLFAPAYNASVPASSPALNAAYLRQYFELDPNIRTVVVELFLYSFWELQGSSFVEQKPVSRRTISDFLHDTTSLFISNDALKAAFRTTYYNFTVDAPTYEIAPYGNFFRPPGYQSKGNFDAFPAAIWRIFSAHPNLKLNKSALNAIQEIIELCRLHSAEPIFVLTPSHAYTDYFIDLIGAWPLYEEWLRRMTLEADIHSFSQPNEWTYEPVELHMDYWPDPFHFNSEMGAKIQLALAGKPISAPAGFERRLTSADVHAYIAEHEEAIHQWKKNQSEFVASVDSERRRLDTKP